MSWLSKNYEKAALGGAAVIALGLGLLGWSKVNGVETDFSFAFKGDGPKEPAVKDAGFVPLALQSLAAPRDLKQADVGGRTVDLFTGIPLFVGRNPADKPTDPRTGDAIHPPITNAWWLQYRLDPGFADSPQRDPDSDGFSNREEFDAKTDPTDPNQFPALIGKVRYSRDESLIWLLKPGFESEGGFTFSYEDSQKGTNRASAAAIVMPNTLFFIDGVMKERFKLLGAEVRNVRNERMKEDFPTTFVRIEDQRPNKVGRIYEIPAQFSDTIRNNFLNYDRTAILRLDALGLGGTDFKVEENTAFALPPTAPKKDYFLKSVTPQSIEIEYTDTDGTKKSVQIPKG